MPGTPTWTAPPASVTTTARPLIDWVHVEGGHGPQTKFKARIFTVAQASIGGFDPAASPSTQDSGVVTTATSSWLPSVNLANGVTYRAYVQTQGTTVGGWSAWSAAREFAIAIVVPVPTDLIPASGSISLTSRPSVDSLRGGAMPNGILVNREWQIASDAGFTTLVTTILET